MIKKEDTDSLRLGHRARLRKKFLEGQLQEYEILELLLTYTIPRCDVRPLARRLMNKYKSIHNLVTDSMESLIKNDGVKENTATFLKLIQNITTLDYKYVLSEKPVFYEPDKLEHYCKLLLGNKTIEEFHVLYLDNAHKLLLDELHSTGTINHSQVYVREIIKKALELNAISIALVHNHPSGLNTFSRDDITMTTNIEYALNKLDMKVYDHFLVANGICYSMRNLHYLDKSENIKTDA